MKNQVCTPNDILKYNNKKSLNIGRVAKAILGMFGMLSSNTNPYSPHPLTLEDIDFKYRNMTILDIGSGTSSFKEEYSRVTQGNVLAIDPMYCNNIEREGILQFVSKGVSSINASIQDSDRTDLDETFVEHALNGGYYSSLRQAGNMFLWDYHRNPNGYRCGALPFQLPSVNTGKFELCLVGNFLLFRDELPYEFVYDSIATLGEYCHTIKISPIITYKNSFPVYFEKLIKKLIQEGVSINFSATQYREFKKSTDVMEINFPEMCKGKIGKNQPTTISFPNNVGMGLYLRLIIRELTASLTYLDTQKNNQSDARNLTMAPDRDFHTKWCKFGLLANKSYAETMDSTYKCKI